MINKKRTILSILLVTIFGGASWYYLAFSRETATLKSKTVQSDGIIQLSIRSKRPLITSSIQVLDSSGKNYFFDAETLLAEHGIQQPEFEQSNREEWVATGEKITQTLRTATGFIKNTTYENFKLYEQNARTSSEQPLVFHDLDCGIGTNNTKSEWLQSTMNREYRLKVFPATPPGQYALIITADSYCHSSNGPTANINFEVT